MDPVGLPMAPETQVEERGPTEAQQYRQRGKEKKEKETHKNGSQNVLKHNPKPVPEVVWNPKDRRTEPGGQKTHATEGHGAGGFSGSSSGGRTHFKEADHAINTEQTSEKNSKTTW